MYKATKVTIITKVANYSLFLTKDGSQLAKERYEEEAKNLLLQKKLKSLRDLQGRKVNNPYEGRQLLSFLGEGQRPSY
jgi:hypothetical protein